MVSVKYVRQDAKDDPAEVDDYLREIAGKGQVYLPPDDLPDDLQYGPIGQCFKNCLLAALGSGGKYQYCEGIGIIDNEAYAHAWLTDGKYAYDLTWRMVLNRTGIVVPAPAFYKGVVLDLEACKDFTLRSGRGGIIPNRHRHPRLFKKVLIKSNLLD